jgi:hypothetical protein
MVQPEWNKDPYRDEVVSTAVLNRYNVNIDR